MKTKRDLTGLKFGEWTVLRYHERRKYAHVWWCLCSCGKEGPVYGSRIGKSSSSCGCVGRKRIIAASITHGMSDSRTYNVWAGMKARCTNPNHPSYKDYGGRGITVCERWIHSFENFIQDMGEAPNGLTLDRIKNDLGYSPDNCIWSDRKAQARNRRSNRIITAFGRSQTLAGWSIETGIKRSTITQRIDYYGYSEEDAVSKKSAIGVVV